jgi:hypothetical protein
MSPKINVSQLGQKLRIDIDCQRDFSPQEALDLAMAVSSLLDEQNPVKAKETAQESKPATTIRDEAWVNGLAEEIVSELTFFPGFDQHLAKLCAVKDIISSHLNKYDHGN